MSRLGGAGAVAPLVTEMPLSSSIEVRLKRDQLHNIGNVFIQGQSFGDGFFPLTLVSKLVAG